VQHFINWWFPLVQVLVSRYQQEKVLISNFRPECCILSFGWSPASEMYVHTFQYTLSHLPESCKVLITPCMKMGQSVPECWHLNYRLHPPKNSIWIICYHRNI
jgi:hypothetical protein